MSGRMLTVSAVEVALRAMDFDLLAELVRRSGAVRTHDQLGAVLRETEHDPVEALRQHVLVLRHALRAAEPGTERHLEVVRGEGYRFREQPVAPDALATLSAPPVQLDRTHRSLTLRGAAVPLRPKVFDLLVELVSRPGQVLTHQQLATSLLRPGRGGPGDHGEIARRVWLLRAAIELNPAQPRLVVTVAGVGYRFDPEQPVPTGVRAVRTAGPIRVDVTRHVVTVDGTRLDLGPKEFALVAELVSHAGELRTHGQLVEAVWGPRRRQLCHPAAAGDRGAHEDRIALAATGPGAQRPRCRLPARRERRRFPRRSRVPAHDRCGSGLSAPGPRQRGRRPGEGHGRRSPTRSTGLAVPGLAALTLPIRALPITDGELVTVGGYPNGRWHLTSGPVTSHDSADFVAHVLLGPGISGAPAVDGYDDLAGLITMDHDSAGAIVVGPQLLDTFVHRTSARLAHLPT